MKEPKGFFYNYGWNQWMGCHAVATGCDNCYAAARFQIAYHLGVKFGPNEPRKLIGECMDRWPDAWERQAAKLRTTLTVYNTSTDPFDTVAPIEFFMALLEKIERTPHLTWLLETKRLNLGLSRLKEASIKGSSLAHQWLNEHPPLNVWMGISCSTQAEVRRYAPLLNAFPAAHRWMQLSPLLEPVIIDGDDGLYELNILGQPGTDGIHWVVVGGEAGNPIFKRIRPCRISWIEGVVNDCKEARIPVFVNNLGALIMSDYDTKPKRPFSPGGRDIDEFPSSVRKREMPNFTQGRQNLQNPTWRNTSGVTLVGKTLMEVFREEETK